MTPQAKTTIPESELVRFDLPTLYYEVQEAFQSLGAYLIAMNNGEIIHGQVNVDNIGLTEPKKQPRIRHQFGFVQPPSTDIPLFDKNDVDAVLIFNQNLQQQDRPLFLILQAVRNEDVGLWADLALKVTSRFVIRDPQTLALHPLVVIGITSLSQGNDAGRSAQRVALQMEHGYGFEHPSLISDMVIRPDEEYLEEDDEEADD